MLRRHEHVKKYLHKLSASMLAGGEYNGLKPEQTEAPLYYKT